MKKLFLILVFFVLTNIVKSQIIVIKELCHNAQYGITSDSVYIEIVINGKIDIRVSDKAHITTYANAYISMSKYFAGFQPLQFDELPNLYQYNSDDTNYYFKYKAELLRFNPTWKSENIIILSE